MRKKAITIIVYLFLLLMSGCCIFSNNQPSSTLRITTTNDSVCDFAIKSFNENASRGIIRDIVKFNSISHSNKQELRDLYPEARDNWNNALNEIEEKYSFNWSGVSLSQIDRDVFKDWKGSNLKDYQKFFLLLNESIRGSYPIGHTDPVIVSSWMEYADIKRRLDADVKRGLKDICPNRDPVKVRALLNIVRLPQTFEECLQP